MSERRFRILRSEGYRDYLVPVSERMTVLDALLYIQKRLERSLAFRFACRQAMCGTCGLRVNGVERLACSTLLSAVPGRTVLVEPLRNLPVVKDLVVDLAPFFRAWQEVTPQFVSSREGTEMPVISPLAPERREIDRHRECISCGICYSSCDVVGRNPSFLGPAALNRTYCLVLDVRDEARQERLDAANSMRGPWSCHTLMACTEVCPKGLRPASAIQGMRRLLAREALER